MKYYLAALTAFALWGFFSLALKPLAAYHSMDILFYRVLVATAVMMLAGLFFRRGIVLDSLRRLRRFSPGERRRTIFLTVIGGVFLCSNWFFFIYLINHISVKAGSFSYLVCPVITTVLAYFILSERLSRRQWIAVVLAGGACMLLALGHFLDVLYSLIVAISYALYLISQRRNHGIDRFTVLTVQMCCSSVILFPFFIGFSGGLPGEPSFYGLIAVIAVLFTIIPLLLNLYALKGVTSSVMGILLYANPLINFLVAVFYFNEEVTPVQVFSYALILVSIIVFNTEYLQGRGRPGLTS